ncbi:MAG: HAMP domain-containing sensor histidine kinase [Sphaerochaetaceae bacterium]|nr:HAMP domain-containing sensor histidine kinase [Sphaerochaetaceae bacterium]
MKKFSNSIVNGKEHLFVISGLVISYILIIIFVLFLFNALSEREELRLQMEAEQAFNSVFYYIKDDPVKANDELQSKGILGVGVYSYTGTKVLSLGDVPNILSKKIVDNFSTWGSKTTGGTATYNYDNDTIEYIRFINRLTVLWDVIDPTLVKLSDFKAPTVSFPDVLYIIMNGTSYKAMKTRLQMMQILAIFVITILFIFVFRIYRNNRKYRIKLDSQRNLVNLGQAARTLTHEIKNPLSSINIQLAILRVKVNPSYRSNLEIIQSEVDRIKILTDKVSEFLHNPEGIPSEFELVEFIQDIISKFPSKIALYSYSTFYVKMDKLRARSVFENLIKNAIESGNNPEVEVIIKKGNKTKTVEIEVKDRGDGLPEGVKDKIYDPFFTTKTTGSGIGLSITKQFVTARGGSLNLFSREGGGTVAQVILPTSANHPHRSR